MRCVQHLDVEKCNVTPMTYQIAKKYLTETMRTLKVKKSKSLTCKTWEKCGESSCDWVCFRFGLVEKGAKGFSRPLITIGKTKVVHAIEDGSNCIR